MRIIATSDTSQPELTRELVRAFFSYDPEGFLVWENPIPGNAKKRTVEYQLWTRFHQHLKGLHDLLAIVSYEDPLGQGTEEYKQAIRELTNVASNVFPKKAQDQVTTKLYDTLKEVVLDP